MTEKKEFDLGSLSVRILECARCHEPVLGERAAGRMTLHCGYCGFEDERELSSRRAPEESSTAYRGRPRNAEGRLVKVDLEETPADMAGKRWTRSSLTAVWREAKGTIGAAADAERSGAEFRLLWVGTSLASAHASGRDFLRARATLETLLELVTLPPYKALVLARLGRLAVLSGAPDLADKWVSAAPRDLRIAEVTSDLRVTDAMIARARGDAKGMLAIIGERDTADEFVGGARWLAVALRVDAHEREDDMALASRVWREVSRASGSKNAVALSKVASAYGLAPRTRRKAQLLAVPALVGLMGVLYGLFAFVKGLVSSDTIGLAPLGIVAVGFLLAMLFTRL